MLGFGKVASRKGGNANVVAVAGFKLAVATTIGLAVLTKKTGAGLARSGGKGLLLWSGVT